MSAVEVRVTAAPLEEIMSHRLQRLDTRRIGISLAAGLVAAALAAAIAIPASSPSLLERARDAAPTVNTAP